MYRFLIIDDEPYIVDWIYELFQQHHELDLDMYKAYSAVEAIDILSKAKIDIVMTDIKMPDMDGIQLLELINNSWPLCKVIFLTSYSEFEYAHIAIKSGAKYLLKTESDDVIVNAVKDMISDIDNILKQNEIIKKAEKQLERAIPIMQREFFQEILRTNDIQVTQNQLDELEVDLRADEHFLLLIGRFDNWFQTKQIQDRAKQSLIIQTITDEFFSPFLNSTFVQYNNSMLTWLIQPKQHTNWDKTVVYAKGSLDSIQSQCMKSLDLTVSFAINNEPSSWKTAAQDFASLLMLLNQGGIGNKGIILTKIKMAGAVGGQADQYEFYQQQVAFWLNKINNLDIYLESGQYDDYFDMIYELKSTLSPIVDKYPSLAIEIYYSVSLILLNYIHRYAFLYEKISVLPEFSQLMNLNSSIPVQELFNIFEKISSEIFSDQRSDKENRERNIVIIINDYIEKNLDKDLSLIRFADLVNLNPSYLSRLYKQLTGFNLSDYIHDTRLNKAMKMLKESNLKIYEIASLVGFESVSYFIRSFKKSMDMTPQEYRDN